MKSHFKFSITVGVLLPVLATFQLCAQNNVKAKVFQIGEFNRSSTEFASGNPQHKVNFVISQSDPAKDWFGTQRSLLSSAGKLQEASIESAPRAISFSLAGPPAETYRLHVALLIENSSVPSLKIYINGKHGSFYLHPRLDYSSGDLVDVFFPAYSTADVEFDFPGSYLEAGANSITLQAIEEADEEVPDAGFHYDAIELNSLPASTGSEAFSTQIEPTIFFHEQNGELLETVDTFIRFSRPTEAGSKAELTIAGQSYHAALRGGYDFGDEKIEFAVREFTPQAEALLTIETDGQKQHFNQSIAPAKKWTIFVVPHIHVDVGFSDYQAKIAAIQARTIAEAMDMTAKHPEFRFSLDGEWDLEQFLQTRSAAQQQRVIEAIKKNQIFVPAQYANLLTGIPTAETLIRSLYPSANFSRKYGTPFDYANITDVPSFSWSYASILASAGVPYLAAGSDNYRGPVLLQGRLNESSPMWWVGPDGKKILLWYSRHYHQMKTLFGLPPLLSAGRDTLPLYLQMYETPKYHANATIIYGTQVENTDLFPQQAELAGKWNAVYTYPRLQYSGFHDAMQDIAKQFGDNISTIRGDGGPYWEDGATSDAYYLSMERWNEARAQSAEKLATLASVVNPLLKTDTAELGRMWTNMVLMDEHTWDSDNSVSDPSSKEATGQLAVKEQFAVNAAAEVDFAAKRSMANLADAIDAGPGSLIVFNSLNWQRSGPVSIDLNKGDEIVNPGNNQTVPFEIISNGNDFNRVRFSAQDVPPVGYKVYMLRPKQEAAAIPAPEQNPSLESPYYKVELDAETGAIRSIYDKQLQRELVSQDSPYRFGEYLYVTGGDKSPNTILHYSQVNPKPELEVHPSHHGRIVSVLRIPSGVVARMESDDLNAPSIKTEIRLFDGEKKIELVEDVDKKEVYSKEAVYFAFPFAMSRPQFQYEIQNGVVDPAKDMYAGAGHEWFTAQHWVSVQQDGVSASVFPLDAPMVTLGDINRGAWPEEFGQRPGNVFSYVMNNYWDTNYRAGQGGHFSFHYVITSDASVSANDLSRMGWEEITPLETDLVTSQDKAIAHNDSTQLSALPAEAGSSRSLDGKQGSFLDVDDPNILLETWKAAEDGDGTILRFLDLGVAVRTVTVRTPALHLGRVAQTDAVERGARPVPLTADDQFHFTIHPHEIVTLRMIAEGR
jgi:hypothetical protein